MNRTEILRKLDKRLAEFKLRDFAELSWHIIEPGRQFVPGWHIDAICDHLEAVTMGHITRLCINIPPGCMKSLLTNVLWPAWEWGPRNLPVKRYVGAAYSQDLTVRDNRRCRNIIQSEWYQELWGDRFQLVGDQNAKTRFDNDKMGFKIATSVGGLGVGERGDRFVIDDGNNIKKVESDVIREDTTMWFTEVVPTRLSDVELSAIINIQQRTHQGDISGVILEKELGYVLLCLPMEFEPERKCFVEVTGFKDPREEEGELLWPNKMTRKVVERDKQTMGSYAVAGQFQQRPAPRGGGMFQRTWWRFFETGHPLRPADTFVGPAVPKPVNFEWVIISVDAAFKSTNTGSRVGMLVIAGKGPFRYILENRTRPMTFRETCENIRALRKMYPHSKIVVEDKANGPAIIDTLRNELTAIIAVNPEGGKESRAAAIQPTVESGHVLLPEGAPWVDDFISEFAMFPAGSHDDQVDALSQALIHMTHGSDVVRALMLGSNW